ncbi:EAL domain-containing protein [Thalassotalea sp. LPB0316]|uniref:bifunctional diguanylate cyclase/phosphodiesterase n=1 Tax=Thalassotalea sp. LPB0316 TaxID=2769490 RepID=UPI001868CF25|nr:EAL domain-containing protein [Thalassotalea sp. LPB0316]QOL25980.1 EAL domain-containing protein [Thalassotalea sp. LPB0316]
MQVTERAEEEFLFSDDFYEDDVVDEKSEDTWKVLIVDDDPEIHSVTQLALSDVIVLGRSLEYLHAYSGQDACQLIESRDDIVLVLLDVVMETDDAGLNVVKYIRDELDRQDIRIVLRTGQPGYAPEESVIKDYDINDYKTKTELTRRKLVTTVYAAIRSYQQIYTINQSQQGLEKVIGATSELLELHNFTDYAHGVLEQFHSLLDNVTSSVFSARGQGVIDGADDLSLYVLAQCGLQAAFVNQKCSQVLEPAVTEALNRCFTQKQHYFDESYVVLYLSRGDFRTVIYLELSSPMPEMVKPLLEVFLTNVVTGYENVHLFQKLNNAAYKDWLTDLPNRLAFVNELEYFTRNDQNDFVAVLIDISHFSDINDGLGQDIGNQLLKAVATRLKGYGNGVKIARVGADVFGLIGLSSILTPEKLSKTFINPFSAGDQFLPVSACFGFCRQEDAGGRGVEVLNQINIALNLAKKDRHVHYMYYAKEMEEQTLWRLGMIRQLRHDFNANRLQLWYQPQLDLSTGRVIGAEALLRWQTEDGQFISPAVFVPLAEYSGLILDIGDWVINQACLQIKELEKNGFDDVGISVNVSIPQFKRTDFVDSIIEATKTHQVKASKLELEITENILMDDPQVVIDCLTRLKQERISIALDDFGTGYSSMSYLQKLPLDRLKVDRSFVKSIGEKEHSFIAETIISLGKQLDLKVIAEGIEELEQQEHLIKHGCDEVQGFYYAKPMPGKEFIAYLRKQQ